MKQYRHLPIVAALPLQCVKKSLYHKFSYPRAVVPLPLHDGIEDLVAIHGAHIGVRNSLGILFRKTICAPSEIVETKDHSASDASDFVDQIGPLVLVGALESLAVNEHDEGELKEKRDMSHTIYLH